MLLPSAISCESPQPSHGRLQSALFASPPASPPTVSSQTALGNIMTTCRSLQSLLAAPASMPASSSAQLPTPPLAHAPPPLKLRLRARPCHGGDGNTIAVRRVVKRAAAAAANKRRRVDEDAHRPVRGDLDSDLDLAEPTPSPPQQQQADGGPTTPSTPKRARIAPEQLPLGLDRSDFHDMHLFGHGSDESGGGGTGTDMEVEADGSEWSAEDDRILVELVLDKLKLSKTEWQDCARSLGMDRHSASRRWRSLMTKGEVGLKTRGTRRRPRLHGTWR
ncbi:hypothetical protein RJ55_07849 [Drechmeria coniospora]|nr:hypothetical protein RJ55_07849 [Drechmeria coniospora]